MSTCSACGREIGTGRFCTHCGQPVETGQGWRTDTAERPLPPPPPPPTSPARTPPPAPAGAATSGPRFKLYADEVGEPTGPPAPPPVPPPGSSLPAAPPSRPRSRGPLWVGVVVAVLLVAGIGIWQLRGDDVEEPREPAAAGTKAPDDQPSAPGPSRSPGDVTADAKVAVPATAPANQDVEGNPVEYVAANLTDGVPETAWRMAGDGTGEELTITLPEESTLRRVGMINGYAKTAKDAQGRTLDWYHGNRRVLTAEWIFDDGTTVSQDLEDTVAVQSVDVDVTTTTITLRLLKVSSPGEGRAARNYTALSELSFLAG